jgi:hypothetical protein
MSTPNIRRRTAALAVMGAIMFAALIVTQAASAGALYACVKKNGLARVYTSKPKCKKGELKLNWNLQGPAAKNGANGSNGTNGTNGTNGKEGKEGKEGVPGPFPATLPTGKTITGAYALAGGGSSDFAADHISWPFRLASVPAVHVIASGETPPTGCSGTALAPAASSGNLCIFESRSSSSTTAGACSIGANACTDAGGIGTDESLKFGVFIRAFATAATRWYNVGTWAVTG